MIALLHMNELGRGGKVVGGTEKSGLARSYRCYSLLFYEIGRGRMTAMHEPVRPHGMKYWFLAALWMGDEQSRLSLVFGSTRNALLRTAPESWEKMSPSYQPSQRAAFTSALYRPVSAFCQIATLILWLNHPLCASPHP